MDQRTIEGLRELVSAGRCDAALDVLYRSHAADVERFIASLRPSASTRDLCQETWVAALRALPRFRFDVSPRAWLFSIARHKAIDVLRRGRRDRALELDHTDTLLQRLPHGQPPSTPFTKIVRERRAAALRSVLAGWDPADRELLELRFVAGLKPSEMVDSLGLTQTPNAVSQRLVRLTARLRSQLSEHDEFARR
jgi:RNA polymerase sigma-70 factor (ECF subfamily)